MNTRYALTLASAILITIASTGANAQADPPSLQQQSGASGMKIRMTIGSSVLTASLIDNPAARDFAALLPLTLTLSDHAAIEKVSDLPKRLEAKGAPSGYAPQPGDIAYYAPWGNLALFHKGFRFSEGLVKLGRFDAGVDVLRRPGPVTARIELIDATKSSKK